MAQVTYRVSDLDGKSKVTGDSTRIVLDGEAVTIDLTDNQRKELRELLSVYFDKGVKVTPKTRSANGTGNANTDSDHNAEVRQWARENGIEVSDRGRISKDVHEKYDAAHPADSENAEKDAA